MTARSVWLPLSAGAITILSLSGCAADESALMCVDQSPASNSIAITNRCNEAIVVMADDGEKLIIAPGLTHQLLRSGRQMGACFAPSEPVLEGQEFICKNPA